MKIKVGVIIITLITVFLVSIEYINTSYNPSISTNEFENIICNKENEIKEHYYRALYHPSNFRENMEYLLKRIQEELQSTKSIFTFYNQNKEIRSSRDSTWIILFDFLILSHSSYFKYQPLSDHSTVLDIFIHNGCGYRNASAIPKINNGFPISEITSKTIVDQNTDDLHLIAARKTDTVLMCRKMDKSVVMQCPEGFIFTDGGISEENMLREYANNHPDSSWIYKPDGGTQGIGILISDDIDEIIDITNRKKNYERFSVNRNTIGGVVQEILPNPLFFDGNRRFSLRILVFVSSRDPFIGYYSAYNFRALLASAKTDENNLGEIISNNHFHRKEANSRNPEIVLDYFMKNGLGNLWTEYTLPAIGDGIHEFLQFENTMKEPNSKQTKFELFGCDILIDSSMKPWFLECNICAGLGKNLKSRSTLFEEMMYILLHQTYFGKNEIPKNIIHWKRLR